VCIYVRVVVWIGYSTFCFIARKYLILSLSLSFIYINSSPRINEFSQTQENAKDMYILRYDGRDTLLYLLLQNIHCSSFARGTLSLYYINI